MCAYRNDQRRLRHRGREFHFVSYEGQSANPARDQAEVPPTWFLIQAGKRWRVMEQMPDQAEEETNRRLLRWVEDHVFG
jgi:hypothetical protein